MADRTSMSVIPVAKSTVTEIEVIAIASDVKVAVAQEIASEDDEGVDLAIASDHAVLEVVLVQAAAATVQDHVIAKGQKGRDQKIVIEADEIGIEARMQIRMNGVKLGLRTNLRTEMITMVKMTTLMAMDTMLKSRLSRKIVSLLAPMKTAVVINKQIICFSSSTLFTVFENPRKNLIQRPVTFKIILKKIQMMIIMKRSFQDQLAFSLFSI